MRKYTLDEVRESTSYSSWWGRLITHYLSDRFVLLIANHSNMRPNTVTGINFLVVTLSTLSFLQGSVPFLVLGAILFFFVYPLDCVDGGLAALKGMRSKSGRYYDVMLDSGGAIIMLAALVYSQFIYTGNAAFLLMGFLYLAVRSLSEVHFFIRKQELPGKTSPAHRTGLRWKFKVLPSVVEADVLILLIGVLLQSLFGMQGAILMALIVSFMVTFITLLMKIIHFSYVLKNEHS